MISDAHAIARTTTITVILLGLRNFSGFYIILITAIVVIVYPQKPYRHPALRELDQWPSLLSLRRVDASITLFSLSRSLALAHVVYDTSAILDCKDTYFF